MTINKTEKNHNFGDMTTLETFGAASRIKTALAEQSEIARIERAAEQPLRRELRAFAK